MVKSYSYWRALDTIARLVSFDFYGGMATGMGINILAALLITNLNSMSVDPNRALFTATGLIIAGALISIGRASLGEIRHSAQPSGGEGEYFVRFQSACGIKGHIAVGLFLTGVLASFALVALMIHSMGRLISV